MLSFEAGTKEIPYSLHLTIFHNCRYSSQLCVKIWVNKCGNFFSDGRSDLFHQFSNGKVKDCNPKIISVDESYFPKFTFCRRDADFF